MPAFGQHFASERAEAALHAIAHDGVADFLETVMPIRIVESASSRAHEQDEAGHGCPLPRIGGEIVLALGEPRERYGG
jgi:hypothetical protein